MPHYAGRSSPSLQPSCAGDLIYYLSGECAKSARHSALQRVRARRHPRFGTSALGIWATTTWRACERRAWCRASTRLLMSSRRQAQDRRASPVRWARCTGIRFLSLRARAEHPLALLHTDVCGPLPVVSKGGSEYFVTVLDDYSKLSVVHPIARKSETPTVIKEVSSHLLETQTGPTTQRLRCDNGSEYINAELKSFCKDKGIKLETTVRYTPEQNGAAERLNRTLLDKVRPMLADSGLSKYAVGRGTSYGQPRAQPLACERASQDSVGAGLRDEARRVLLSDLWMPSLCTHT